MTCEQLISSSFLFTLCVRACVRACVRGCVRVGLNGAVWLIFSLFLCYVLLFFCIKNDI